MKGENSQKRWGFAPYPIRGAAQRPEPPVVLFDAQGRRFTREACEV